jgi:glycosyltransferase involved in cell wall biosynthesis
MRIAVISSFLFDTSVGGVENHIRFLARELAARGHEIAVFKPEWNAESGWTDLEGIRVRRIGLGRPWCDPTKASGQGVVGYFSAFLHKISFTKGAREVCRQVDEYRPDLVWQHDFLSGWLSARLLSGRYPVVLTNHQGQYLLMKASAVWRRVLPYLLRHYAAVIGPSRELTPSEHPNTRTIHNGVDTEYFRPLYPVQRAALRRRLLGSDEKFVVLCPRRWAPTKGVLVFAEALCQLGRKHPGKAADLLVVFAGNGCQAYPRYAAEVVAVLSRCGIETRLAGDLDLEELRQQYQCADLVAIPSLLEAVSLSALEAMACGTPVLATRVGGMPELIDDERSGWLVNAGSAEALCAALARAIENRSACRALASAGLREVRERFTWRAIADETERVLINAAALPAGVRSAAAVAGSHR